MDGGGGFDGGVRFASFAVSVVDFVVNFLGLLELVGFPVNLLDFL